MLKWILICIGALVVILLGIGGYAWIVMNRPMDQNSAMGRAYEDNFKKEFVSGCETNAAKAAGNVDATMQAKFAVMCSCAADATYEEYKDQPPIKLITLADDPEAQQKIQTTMRQCAQQAGIQ
jgi:hypothetical protein